MIRLQGFMDIISLAKQIQSSFNKSLHCHELLVRMQIHRILCLRLAVVFGSYLMIFSRWNSLIWPIRVCAAEQGMVFSVLSHKHGIQFHYF